MKKVFLGIFLSFVIAFNAFAYGFGGFQDAKTQNITIQQATKLPDNSFVVLQGHIVKRLSSDEYLFKDETATIVVEIDSEKWLGQTVAPEDFVELSGEIDKDFRNNKIDVDNVKIINKSTTVK